MQVGARAPHRGDLRTFRALGFRFGLRSNDRRAVAAAARVLAPLADHGPVRVVYDLEAAPGPGPIEWSLTRDDEAVARGPGLGGVLAALFTDINRQLVATDRRHLLIHASAATAGRRGLVFPAPSGAGKSTLVAGLVRDGLGYLTDEITAIDPVRRRIEAFPKSLSLEPGSQAVLADLAPPPDDASSPAAAEEPGDEWQVDPRSIRADAVVDWAEPAFVIAPSYRAGAATTLVQIPRSEAVFLLGQQTFNLAERGRAGLEALADVVRGCDCYRLEVGDLDAACGLVTGLVSDRRRSDPDPT